MTLAHSSLDFSLIKVIKLSRRWFNIWIKSFNASCQNVEAYIFSKFYF